MPVINKNPNPYNIKVEVDSNDPSIVHVEMDLAPFFERFYYKELKSSLCRIDRYVRYARSALKMNDECREYDMLLDEMDDIWWDMEDWEREFVEEEIVRMSEDYHANSK